MDREMVGGCGGSVATAVVVTLVVTCAAVGIGYLLWKRYRSRKKGKQLVLETNVEQGMNDYAFDNPCFKDATPAGKNSDTKPKWNYIVMNKSEKKRTQDDIALNDPELKVVSLRSADFAGLGFNICGNMREGIFIKDVLQHGPATDKIKAGDKIHSLTISFEHIVLEDALTILSYASPYEIKLETRSGLNQNQHLYQQQQNLILHPLYKSSSLVNIHHQKVKKNLFMEPSNPIEKLKNNLENKIEVKFGVRVLPPSIQSPKAGAQNENENNVNLEKVVDGENLVLVRSSSGIKRDFNGIPQEIPDHMLNAAMAARHNRKSIITTLATDFVDSGSSTNILDNNVNGAIVKSPKKQKGKAPAPPHSKPESISIDNEEENKTVSSGSDSELEDECSQSRSVDVVSDITVHQTEMDDDNENDDGLSNEESSHSISSSITESKARKTASTGDLSKIEKEGRKTGTLERAKSLDITEAPRKRGKGSDEDHIMLMDDGHNLLKKSSDWGNLENLTIIVRDSDMAMDNIDKIEEVIDEVEKIGDYVIKTTTTTSTTMFEEPKQPVNMEIDQEEKEKDDNEENKEEEAHTETLESRVTKVHKTGPTCIEHEVATTTNAISVINNSPHVSCNSTDVPNSVDRNSPNSLLYNMIDKMEDTNISDDIKVSRGSLERQKINTTTTITNNDQSPKSEVAQLCSITINSEYQSSADPPSSLTLEIPDSTGSSLTYITEIQVTNGDAPSQQAIINQQLDNQDQQQSVQNKSSKIQIKGTSVSASATNNTSPTKSRIPVKIELKNDDRNVSVTSIRSSSKIPSGYPSPPRRKSEDGTPGSTNTTNNFKQWVFNPTDQTSTVTNISVDSNK